MTCAPDIWPQNSIEFLLHGYVFTIFKRMLQKYCPSHEKVEPRHTNSCNCHAKCSLQSNISVTSKLQPFQGFSARGFNSNIGITEREIPAPATQKASCRTLFKSTTPANVFATLTNSCACHAFCNVSKSSRLPRETEFEPPKLSGGCQCLTILTSKPLSRHSVV